MERRERTHRLIELGGLVQKAGLPDLIGDDRAALFGALLSLADALSEPPRDATIALWRRRGRRAFAAGEEQTAPQEHTAAPT